MEVVFQRHEEGVVVQPDAVVFDTKGVEVNYVGRIGVSRKLLICSQQERLLPIYHGAEVNLLIREGRRLLQGLVCDVALVGQACQVNQQWVTSKGRKRLIGRVPVARRP